MIVQIRSQERLRKLQKLTSKLKAGKTLEESLGKRIHNVLIHVHVHVLACPYMYMYLYLYACAVTIVLYKSNMYMYKCHLGIHFYCMYTLRTACYVH